MNKNCIFSLSVSLIAVMINIILSVISNYIPNSGVSVLDEMILMMQMHKNQLFSSSVLIFGLVFVSVCINFLIN